MSYLFLLFSVFGFAQFDTLGGKKIVALGESGHAVAEYHNYRAKISRTLIEKHGFRNILVEEDILAGFKIAEAINSCRLPSPDPDYIKKAFMDFDSATYRHEEFYVFYNYLCEWNKRHPTDPVRLSGVDVWSPYWDLAKYLKAELLHLGLPEVTKPLSEAIDQCFLWSVIKANEYANHPDWIHYEKYQRVEPGRHANCLSALFLLKKSIDKNASTIITTLDQARLAKIYIALDTATTRQNIRDAYAFHFSKAMGYRDAAQARNVLAHLKMFKSNSPTIFMAHNVHVFQKMSTVISGDISSPYSWANVTSAGEWLKAHFGEQMAIVGIGGHDIKSLRDGQYPLPTSEQSLDLKLHQKGKNTAFIKAPKGQWWIHNEGSNNGLWIKPEDQFDFYFFIDKSGPATKFNL